MQELRNIVFDEFALMRKETVFIWEYCIVPRLKIIWLPCFLLNKLDTGYSFARHVVFALLAVSCRFHGKRWLKKLVVFPLIPNNHGDNFYQRNCRLRRFLVRAFMVFVIIVWKNIFAGTLASLKSNSNSKRHVCVSFAIISSPPLAPNFNKLHENTVLNFYRSARIPKEMALINFKQRWLMFDR